jgi:hypothetical protein
MYFYASPRTHIQALPSITLPISVKVWSPFERRALYFFTVNIYDMDKDTSETRGGR